MITLTEFFEDYERGMNFLYMVAPEFALLSQALGIPRETTKVPTACVSWDKSQGRITFEINAEFIHKLKDSEIAAVIAHETYHVVLKHNEDARDSYYKFPHILYKAQECIINDSLMGNVGVDLPEIGALYGTKIYETDFSDFTSREGYDFIVDKNEDSETNKNGSSSDSGGDSEAGDHDSCGGVQVDFEDLEEFSESVEKSIKEAVKQMKDFSNLPDNVKDKIGEILKNLPSYGVGDSSSFHRERPSGVKMNWTALLKRINPKIPSSGKLNHEEKWTTPPRSLVSVYPKIVLPSYKLKVPDSKNRGKALPTLIVALDLSGSIPRELVNDLVSLVDSVPEDYINAIPVTWSNFVLEYDKETQMVVDPCGTNIDSVVKYAEKVEKEIGKTPYVLVITDGGFGLNKKRFQSLEQLKTKWFWCAIQDHDVDSILLNVVKPKYSPSSSVYRLSDFLQKISTNI